MLERLELDPFDSLDTNYYWNEPFRYFRTFQAHTTQTSSLLEKHKLYFFQQVDAQTRPTQLVGTLLVYNNIPQVLPPTQSDHIHREAKKNID